MLEKAQVIGKRLITVRQTRWSEPVFILKGIAEARYSKMVYRLETGLWFESGSDELLAWDGSEELIDLEAYGESDREYLGQVVTEVITGEPGPSQVYLILGNGTVLCSGYYLDVYGSGNLVCGLETLTEYDSGPFKTLWEGADWIPNAV
jgi:hypothetical protein